MVLVTSVRDYINRMLQDTSGMKVLILDSETVSNVSIVYSQSELLPCGDDRFNRRIKGIDVASQGCLFHPPKFGEYPET
ncbi:unnamed protein product [Microthlaspi erraticum]|uniref:Uncharacterized protein n=1 Tax=Microthlaspi erraticum TaxID=1685480 RepID=A0A6D2HE46_9BRAS|nr:unnamed protein product [Microthlaspi erraticum]